MNTIDVVKCMDEYPTGFKSRLEDYRKYLAISQTEFAESVGISKESYKQIKDNPSLQMLYKFIRKYPELSLDYLVAGVGSMLRTSTSPNVNNFDLSSVGDNSVKVGNNNTNTSISTSRDLEEKVKMMQQIIDLQQQVINLSSKKG